MNLIATTLAAPQNSNLIINDILYIVDTDRSLDKDSALQLLQDKDAHVINGHVFNLGSKQTRYWLYINAGNQTDQSASLRLLASVPYRALLKVYLVDSNKVTRLILDESANTTFEQRQNPHRLLNSSVFDIAAQQKLRLLIEYESVGSSYLPLSLVSDAELNQLMYDDSVNAAFFYSFSIAAIIIFLLFALAMMNLVSAMYGFLFMLGLLLISSMDGFAFKYLWPQSPQWNNLSPLVLLYFLSSFGLLLSSIATLKNKQNKIFIRMMQILSGISFVMGMLCFLLPFVLMFNFVTILLGLMFISQAYAISSWVSLGQKRNAIAVITACLLAVFVVSILLVLLDISFLPESIYLSSPHIIYTSGSLATMATIIAHVSGLRLDHEKALENELVLMKREAETNKALFESEQNYSRAKEIARLRQEQLATASHDMRQPLVSLRSTMDVIAHGEADNVKTQLRNAFDYLENLCNNYLRDTHPENKTEVVSHEQEQGTTETTEPYPANLIINTAARMFKEEAQQRGLLFHYQDSTAVIAEPPLIIMRIVTNLLSNAIKHTMQGKILLGARRRQDTLSIQVLDTGCGMTKKQLTTLSHAYEKGPDSSGQGLGLAICRQQAEQNGMKLTIQSTPNKGTCCTLDILLVKG